MSRLLVLMRHAEAELAPGQASDDQFSVGDHPLSRRGRAQAEVARELVAKLPIEAVVSSPALRCVETAGIVAAQTGLATLTHADLLEFRVAQVGTAYPAMVANIRAMAQSLQTTPDAALEGGATFQKELARFRRGVERPVSRARCALVLGHGIANRAYLASVLGMPAGALFRLAQDHACVNLVEFRDDRPIVRRLNATGGPLEWAPAEA